MARFNRNIRPVQSLKHVVDTATSAVAGGIISTVEIANADSNPILANVTEVNEGSKINAIFMRVEAKVTTNFTSVPRVYMIVVKNSSNQVVTPYPANVGADQAKRFVIHQEMMMVGESADNSGGLPRTMFMGVIKIPRGYSRMGYNDRINVAFSLDVGESTGICNVCVQAIYKEYQ